MESELSKVAHELATLAVERKHMPKQANGEGEGFKLSPTAQSAIIGALLGGGGTGLVSSFSGRRGKDVLRDMLLGAAVGGAGGAAYPTAKETIEEVIKNVSKDPKAPGYPEQAWNWAKDKYVGGDKSVFKTPGTSIALPAGVGAATMLSSFLRRPPGGTATGTVDAWKTPGVRGSLYRGTNRLGNLFRSGGWGALSAGMTSLGERGYRHLSGGGK